MSKRTGGTVAAIAAASVLLMVGCAGEDDDGGQDSKLTESTDEVDLGGDDEASASMSDEDTAEAVRTYLEEQTAATREVVDAAPDSDDPELANFDDPALVPLAETVEEVNERHVESGDWPCRVSDAPCSERIGEELTNVYLDLQASSSWLATLVHDQERDVPVDEIAVIHESLSAAEAALS